MGQELQLFAGRALFWKEKELLVISDCHFGKSAHFQKHGISLNSGPEEKDLDRLAALQAHTKAKTMLFLGDLFHSKMNDQCAKIARAFKDIPCTKVLVKGNHDILSADFYATAGLFVESFYLEEPFCFTHEPGPYPGRKYYVIAGHIHPAVTLKGKRSFLSVTAPCFYFSEDYAVLPAFGSLTGNEVIKPAKKDKVFIIAGNGVFPL